MAHFAPDNMKLVTTLPAASFDVAGLTAWANSLCEKYQGLVVTEDMVSEIKAEMAELNKVKSQVESARQAAVTALMEPIEAFKADVKKVTSVFETTYRALQEQVKVFTEKERDAKREVVAGIIRETLSCYEIEPFEIPVQDKWLNKSTSQKAIREAVTEIINAHISELEKQGMATKLQQERAALIERVVASNNRTYRLDLPVAQFMTPELLDPNTDSGVVCSRIYSAFAEKVRGNGWVKGEDEVVAYDKDWKEQQQAEVAPTACQPADPVSLPWEEPQQQAETPAPAVEEITTMQFFMSWDASNDEEIRAMLRTIKALCTSFSARRIK